MPDLPTAILRAIFAPLSPCGRSLRPKRVSAAFGRTRRRGAVDAGGAVLGASRGLSTLRVATQMGNTAALKRYILSGANVESTAYWLYR